MTSALAEPISRLAQAAEPGPIQDWRVVPAKTRMRFTVGRLLGAIHGTLNTVSGVVRLIEGQPRYTHVDIRVPVAALDNRTRRRLGLDAGPYPFVSFYGWRVRGNPRRSFALDGELRVGELRRDVVVNVSATDHCFDDATGTEEATFRAQLVVDRRIRLSLDVTLARVAVRSRRVA
jgi:polyisoprenoid-binding protein YceI